MKAKLLGFALLDMAVDLAVPLAVYALLSAVGVSTYVALAAGGVLVAGKAGLGRMSEWRWGRRAAVALTATVLALIALAALSAAGVSDVLAAAVAGVIVAIPILWNVFGRGRVDGFGLLVIVEIAASFVITLISDDPRFVLARPAIYTAIAGGYMFASCWRRPFMIDAVKPIAAGGDPVRARAYENAWSNSARFRAIERLMTAGLGVVLLAEAVLRVVVVYSAPTADIVEQGLASQLPGIVLFVVFIVLVRLFAVPRVSAVVDAEQALLVKQEPATP